MLTTIVALMIVLGLMVSLARQVRRQSAESLTKTLLHNLDALMNQYYAAHRDAGPVVAPLTAEGQVGPGLPDEPTLQHNARVNNEQFMRVLRGMPRASRVFGELPLSVYDETAPSLRDAWGNPIAYLARSHPDFGTPPGGGFFFFSAGPDRHYLTRVDNLYSYEGQSSGEGGK